MQAAHAFCNNYLKCYNVPVLNILCFIQGKVEMAKTAT